MENDSFSHPELSVVILCYRAGKSARDFVLRTRRVLEEAGVGKYELVLVGNYIVGAHDETPEVVRALSQEYSNIRYSALPKRGMMGWDMKTGLTMAQGRYIAVIDGDGQMPVEDIVKVYKKIRKENLDGVKTRRMSRGDNPWRKIVSFFYNILFSVLFPGLQVRDINAKPKIFTREAYEKMNLVSDDWFIDAEIMICARRLKLKIGEVPTVFLGLTGRRSFVRPKAIFEFMKNLFVYRIREFKNKK